MSSLCPALCVLAILSIGPHSLLIAQEPPLVTDRPDQTESSFTVPKGLFQIEAGWGYGELEDASSRLEFQAFPQALLRIGLLRRFELRVGIPGLEIERTESAIGASRISGLVDATLGFKAMLAQEKGLLPQTAFLSTLVIPSGDRELTSDRFDPAFRFAFSHTLSDRLSLGYNLGMLWFSETNESGSSETASVFDWTVALGVSGTEKLGFFVEAFGVAPIDAESRTATSVDSGVTYLLTPRLQLDGTLGAGLSSAAPDWTVGLGVSFRFPRASR